MSRYAMALELPDDIPDWRAIEILEAQGELWRQAIEEEFDVEAGPVFFYDPMHPDNLDCGCVGPEGWHCPGEDSEHWAKSSTPPEGGTVLDIECGHCGFAPGDS